MRAVQVCLMIHLALPDSDGEKLDELEGRIVESARIGLANEVDVIDVQPAGTSSVEVDFD